MSEKKKNHKLLKISAIVALTTVGCTIVPKVVKKGGDKLYKRILNNDEIDFDQLGPEIVKKDDEEEEINDSRHR